MFKFKKNYVTIQQYKCIFTTIDGATHNGFTTRWAIADRLRCTVPDYVMIDIKSQGYIWDENHNMYILSNVISIEWIKVDEKVIVDTFSRYDIFIDESDTKED